MQITFVVLHGAAVKVLGQGIHSETKIAVWKDDNPLNHRQPAVCVFPRNLVRRQEGRGCYGKDTGYTTGSEPPGEDNAPMIILLKAGLQNVFRRK